MINRQTMMKFFLISLFLIGISYSQLEAKYDFMTVGEITAITDSSITMNDTQFEVNSLTAVFTENGTSINYSTLATGDRVKIVGVILNNIKIANVITLLEDADSNDLDEIEAKGTITALSSASLTVNGIVFTFKPDTKVYLEGQGLVDASYLELGQQVEVEGYVSNDTTYAKWIKIHTEDRESSELEIKGTITALGDGSVTVNSTLFYVNADTKIMLEDSGSVEFSYLAVGFLVEVEGFTSGDSNFAQKIEIEREEMDDSNDVYEEFEVKGEIKALTLTSVTVDSAEFQINVDTKVVMEGKGVMTLSDLKVGQMVEVSGYFKGDTAIARVIKIEKDSLGDTSRVEIEMYGTITELTDSTFTVDSNTVFRFTPDTRVYMKGEAAVSDLEAGQKVEVKGYTHDSVNYALFIKIKLEDDKGIDLEAEGIITSLSPTELKIDSLSFELNSQTVVVLAGKGRVTLNELKVGQTVEVKAYLSGGVYVAKIIKIKEYTDYKTLTVIGEITAKDDTTMTVNETRFLITSETEFFGKDGVVLTFLDFNLGMMVKVKAVTKDSVNTALRVYLITPDSIKSEEKQINFVEEQTLVVGSQIYMVNSTTEVFDTRGYLTSYFVLNDGMAVSVDENLVGGRLFASKIQIMSTATTVETATDNENVQFTNYPNPFSDHTVLSFNLTGTADVSLEIYDRLGAKVMTIYNGQLDAGQQKFDLNINGSSIADGVYFAKLRINGNVIVNKLIKQ